MGTLTRVATWGPVSGTGDQTVAFPDVQVDDRIVVTYATGTWIDGVLTYDFDGITAVAPFGYPGLDFLTVTSAAPGPSINLSSDGYSYTVVSAVYRATTPTPDVATDQQIQEPSGLDGGFPQFTYQSPDAQATMVGEVRFWSVEPYTVDDLITDRPVIVSGSAYSGIDDRWQNVAIVEWTSPRSPSEAIGFQLPVGSSPLGGWAYLLNDRALGPLPIQSDNPSPLGVGQIPMGHENPVTVLAEDGDELIAEDGDALEFS